MGFGGYGEVEDGREDFRWEELERRDGAASGAQAGCALGRAQLARQSRLEIASRIPTPSACQAPRHPY